MGALGARRWWGLGALALSGLVVGLDLTVLNVALPTLATDLHASTGDLQWFANAYNLVLAAVLLPAGLLGDRFGRKTMLLGALTLFGVASAACAYAPSVGVLIGSRAVLGLGAAFLIPMAMSMLTVLFGPDERARALTIWVTANAIGIPLGPIVGGLLLDTYWWGSVFLINVPVILAALMAVAVLLPQSRSSHRTRLDVPGVLASSVGLVALTYGVIEAGELGWGDVRAVASMVGGLAVLALFAAWQRRLARRARSNPASQPLVDPGLFRSASFTWGTILVTMVTFAMFGLLFTMPQFFQAVNGVDALGTGLRLLPIIGGMLVGARAGGRLIPRVGAKVAVAVGFALLAAGLFAGATTDVQTGYGFAAAWFSVVGLGLGLVMPAAMDAALSTLAVERSGVGSAVIQAIRQVGGAIGVAVLGTVLNSTYRNGLDLSGVPEPAAGAVRKSVSGGVAVAQQVQSTFLLADVRESFVQAMDVMLWVCGGLAVAGIALTLAFLPRRSAPVGAPQADAAESVQTVVV